MGKNDRSWYVELGDLLDVDDGLSDYELGFVESMSLNCDQYENYIPTAKQKAKIAEIWDKHCGWLKQED